MMSYLDQLTDDYIDDIRVPLRRVCSGTPLTFSERAALLAFAMRIGCFSDESESPGGDFTDDCEPPVVRTGPGGDFTQDWPRKV